MTIETVSEIVYQLNQNLTSYEAEIATHIYLAIENLMLDRPLAEELVQQFLQDMLSSQPNIYSTIFKWGNNCRRREAGVLVHAGRHAVTGEA